MKNSRYIYEIGELVIFINDYGVNWGQRTITSREMTSYGPAYYIQPTDTPWFAIPERNLYPDYNTIPYKAEQASALKASL